MQNRFASYARNLRGDQAYRREVRFDAGGIRRRQRPSPRRITARESTAEVRSRRVWDTAETGRSRRGSPCDSSQASRWADASGRARTVPRRRAERRIRLRAWRPEAPRASLYPLEQSSWGDFPTWPQVRQWSIRLRCAVPAAFRSSANRPHPLQAATSCSFLSAFAHFPSRELSPPRYSPPKMAKRWTESGESVR